MIATFDVLMGVSLTYLEFCFYNVHTRDDRSNKTRLSLISNGPSSASGSSSACFAHKQRCQHYFTLLLHYAKKL